MHQSSNDALQRAHEPAAVRARLGRTVKGSIIGDAVLGGIDGCVTTLAVIAGTTGAGFPPLIAVVLGLANLVADGFSMAVSNFEAIKARRDFVDAVRRAEYEHIRRVPEGEREELRQIFASKGFSGVTLETIVATLSRDPALWVDTMMTEEHRVQTGYDDPLRSALATFSAFLAVGAVPLLPFIAFDANETELFPVSAGLGAAMFFTIGSVKSLFLAKPWLRSGFDTLLTGGAAATLAWLTGYVLRISFDIGAV